MLQKWLTKAKIPPFGIDSTTVEPILALDLDPFFLSSKFGIITSRKLRTYN